MVKMMIAKDDRPYLSCFLEVGEDNGGRCLASRTGHGTRDGGLQKGFYNTGHDCNHTRNTSIGFVKDNPSDRWIFMVFQGDFMVFHDCVTRAPLLLLKS